MSLARPMTSMAGFRCDTDGCTTKAIYTPVLRVPYHGWPTDVEEPMTAMVNVHVCVHHWKSLRGESIMSKELRDVVEEMAAARKLRPAWKRAYLEKLFCHSDAYQRFLEATGTVAPGDAIAPGSIIMPDLPHFGRVN